MRVRSLLLLAMLVCLAQAPAMASLSGYYVSYGTGNAVDMTSATTIWSSTGYGSYNYGGVTMFSIGFNFVFDGVTYNTMSASMSGCVGLGSTYVNSSLYNSFSSVNVPMLMPFWDQMRVDYGGSQLPARISRIVTGSAPNRVLVVEWKQMNTQGRYVGNSCFKSNINFQVRLYEGTNKIEFYYGTMSACSAVTSDCYGNTTCYSTSASVGIAASASDWISVLPQTGSLASVRYPSSYNVDIVSYPIAQGTVYTFQPCNIGISGNLAQGGTSGMLQGDTLMRSITVQRGSTQGFTPLNVTNTIAGCTGTRTWRASISGLNASEYSVSPTTGTVTTGASYAPTIFFTPGALGVRRATLTITDDNNFTRSFELQASGSPRIQWIPTIADGGTTNMANGDTLMRNVAVNRRTYRDLQPFRLYNYNTNPAATPASITVQLDSFGVPSVQYQLIGPTTASLTAGQSFTPVIRFNAMGVGAQEARLIVNADGEVRTFVLSAISAAPAIAAIAGGYAADPNNPTFVNVLACAGEVSTTVPFVIRNSGMQALVISRIEAFATDTTMGQGTPPFALIRDGSGNLIPFADYRISQTPPVIPITATPSLPLPFTVGPNSSANLYLTFVGQRPGKRYARIYLYSNAENLTGIDPDGVQTLGLLSFDGLGRSVGSALASTPAGAAVKSVVFPATAYRDTSFAWLPVSNAGTCELRISRAKLTIADGDVNEFAMLSVFRNSAVDANGNYVIAPGATDSIRLRFIPSRSGTRQARLRMQTNDSSLGIPGISEVGARYVDIHGRALAGLDGHDLVLAPVVIGSFVTGVVTFENSSSDLLQVDRIGFLGGDAAEFTVDAPAVPITVPPGAKLNVQVRLTPVGSPGERRTLVALVTNTNDTITALVRGEAGTQELIVTPTALFDNVAIGVGEAVRRSVMITNNGTMPLRLTSIDVNGADKANYRLGIMPRYDIGAGATEYLEITFAPSTQGQSSAQLDVVANGVTHSVALGGTALRARGGDPTTGALSNPGGSEFTTPGELSSPAAAGTVEAHGFAMMATRPNPATTSATIEYTLGSAASVRIDLFNARGELVRTVVDQQRAAGRYTAVADLAGLAEGSYRAVLTAGSVRLVQPVVVVR